MDKANSEAVLTFDGDHRSALAETMELPGGSPDYAANSALARTQTCSFVYSKVCPKRKELQIMDKIGRAAHDNALKKPYNKIV